MSCVWPTAPSRVADKGLKHRVWTLRPAPAAGSAKPLPALGRRACARLSSDACGGSGQRMRTARCCRSACEVERQVCRKHRSVSFGTTAAASHVGDACSLRTRSRSGESLSHSSRESPACRRMSVRRAGAISWLCGLGIVRRNSPLSMNRCFPPAYGPSKPCRLSPATSWAWLIGGSRGIRPLRPRSQRSRHRRASGWVASV